MRHSIYICNTVYICILLYIYGDIYMYGGTYVTTSGTPYIKEAELDHSHFFKGWQHMGGVEYLGYGTTL